jgi:hypothetical protein
MIRRFALHLAVLSCAATFGALGALPASAQVPTVSCTGSTQTSVSPTAVTVTGTATCNGVATLSLTTTYDVGGLVSSVQSLVPALPNVPVPVSTTIPAVGASAACAVLANAGTSSTIATSCSGGT